MFGDDGRSTATVPPPPRARLGRRSSAPSSSSPQGLPTRRRWGRFAAGAVLALLGAWVFATLYVSAGERVEVLALSRDVGQWEEIEDDDLRTVRVAAEESEVDTVDAGDRDEVVGRKASSALHEGQLLTASVLTEEGDGVIAPDEGAVGVEITPAKAELIAPGMDVDVVVSPPAGSVGQDVEAIRVSGWIQSVGKPDDQTRTVAVSVVVGQEAILDVASGAVDDRVAFVAREGSQG
jgi:hypothetical protein